jgi:CRISPR-associated endonuclease/helicase Cas3
MVAYENIARAAQSDDGGWRRQALVEHLNGTAQLAGEFAAVFGNRDWGELLGLWHDLGKFNPKWQRHIRTQTGYDPDAQIESGKGKINHSTAGAVQALQCLKESPPDVLCVYFGRAPRGRVD